MSKPVSSDHIQQRILLIRGQKVMLDEYLAELYGVKTKILNQAVKRNRKRFPGDFMFQLSIHEVSDLRSQIVTSNEGRGGRRHLPYAFTEQGVAMLSTVLNSERAVQMNIEIMRAFVRLRHILSTNKTLAEKFAELERRVASHDEHIRSLFEAIRQLMTPPQSPRRRIGFGREESK